jgi:hypothetical protein
MSRLYRQCGILNISQPYRPTQPVTGIALLFFIFTYKAMYLKPLLDASVHEVLLQDCRGIKGNVLQREV